MTESGIIIILHGPNGCGKTAWVTERYQKTYLSYRGQVDRVCSLLRRHNVDDRLIRINLLVEAQSLRSNEDGTTPWLYYDKPEKELHPYSQEKLSDILIDACFSCGINIIVETHSPFIMGWSQWARFHDVFQYIHPLQGVNSMLPPITCKTCDMQSQRLL